MFWSLVALAAAIVILAGGVHAAPPATHAAPLEGGVDPARIEAIAAMLANKPAGLGPALGDREGWKRLAAAKAFAQAVAGAERDLKTPLPEMTEAIYLQYKNTGRRTAEYNNTRGERIGRIARCTTAECIENKGRFLPPLEEALRSVCAEPTWVYAFHDAKLENFKGTRIDVDLSTAQVAQTLGQCLYMLGDRLTPETRQLALQRLGERVFAPYRKAVDGTGRPQWWITSEMNWNTVCHAGVVLAAQAVLADRRERAFYVAAAEKYTPHFLNGFGGDGYCAEGMGYWNYGFSHFVQLAETVFQVTRGTLDLYSLPGARAAAMYPAGARIVGDIYPAYADCALSVLPSGDLLGYLNRRYQLGLPGEPWSEPSKSGHGFALNLVYGCPNSATTRPAVDGKASYEIRSFFPHGGVLTGRPLAGSKGRMAVSLKGGHNDEPHNHNDVGSFVVVVDGEPLTLDPGGEVYTARTFGPNRYDSKLLNSFGHPVPVVAGQLQQSGSKARGVIVHKDFTEQADTFALDLSSAYAVKELTALKRTFVFNRQGEGSLTVTDDFAFTSPRTFGSALLTYAQWKALSPTELLIHGKAGAVKVTINAGGIPFELKAEKIEEENHSKTQPTRIGINLVGPQAAGQLVLKLTPAAVP